MKKMYILPEMIVRRISLEGPLADSYSTPIETPEDPDDPSFEMGEARGGSWDNEDDDIWAN